MSKKIVQIKFDEAIAMAAKNKDVYRLRIVENKYDLLNMCYENMNCLYKGNKNFPNDYIYFYFAKSEDRNESN